MWHKADWMGRPIRLELSLASQACRRLHHPRCPGFSRCCNLRSSLLRWGTRPIEWGARWDSNSVLLVKLADDYTTRGAQHSRDIVIYKALCFDVAQGRLNGTPIETRTHSCRFASQAFYPRCPRFSKYWILIVVSIHELSLQPQAPPVKIVQSEMSTESI